MHFGAIAADEDHFQLRAVDAEFADAVRNWAAARFAISSFNEIDALRRSARLGEPVRNIDQSGAI